MDQLQSEQILCVWIQGLTSNIQKYVVIINLITWMDANSQNEYINPNLSQFADKTIKYNLLDETIKPNNSFIGSR